MKNKCKEIVNGLLPLPMKAYSHDVTIHGYPFREDYRVIVEELYQRMMKVIEEIAESEDESDTEFSDRCNQASEESNKGFMDQVDRGIYSDMIKAESENSVNGIKIAELKEIIREVLWGTIAAGNGGYYSQFGPVLFSKMVKLTDYDLDERKIGKNG